MSNTLESQEAVKRPPVIAVMGHVDHGKSTLLDYIRKSNITDAEAGGITQHIAAYEADHIDDDNNKRRLTFIDTPGHAAFETTRNRGAQLADIAILIVSAEDSVQEQSKEAIRMIQDSGTPFVVAINKIDSPKADVQKTKEDLMTHEIFVEGFGGDTPVAEISALNGTGIKDLLDTLLLVADMEEFTGEPSLPASGFVIESHLDEQRGVTATLLIKEGTLVQGKYVVVENTMASTRMLKDFSTNNITDATFSSPVQVIGFSGRPTVGSPFYTVETKKEAEKTIKNYQKNKQESSTLHDSFSSNSQVVVPVIVKADVVGTQDAIVNEIQKRSNNEVSFKIIKTGIGNINESDIQLAATDTTTIVLGFNVNIDNKARQTQAIDSINIQTFDIIYRLIDWLKEEQERRRMKQEVTKVTGRIKILQYFSSTKHTHVIGGYVEEGELKDGDAIRLLRKEKEIAKGTVDNLQHGKAQVESINADNECGIMLSTTIEPAKGDYLEALTTVIE